MKEYQIHVISKILFNSIIYEGPDAGKKIYLYLHDAITTMLRFLKQKVLLSSVLKKYMIRKKSISPTTVVIAVYIFMKMV